MKRKIIGICICMLVIATAVPAVTSLKDNGITPTGINSTLQPSKKMISPTTAGNVIFSQRPYLPTESWSFFTSAKNLAYLCQDDFWDLQYPIDDVHWWGLTLIWNNGWYPGVPNGMTFDIIFYQDNAGAPGAVVPPSPFYNIVPTFTITPYTYNGWPMYYFETNIPRISLASGWLSIQSNNSQNGSSLLWSASPQGNFNALQNSQSLGANLAFNLTYMPTPDLDCVGSITWTDVPPGTMTSAGSFEVWNIGQPGSLLNWKIDKAGPAPWGAWTDWSFSPSDQGTNLALGTPFTVQVTVMAPPTANTQFSGVLKVYNTDNPTDFDYVNVSLKTPLNQGFHNQPFLARFFELFPYAFPILRHILGY